MVGCFACGRAVGYAVVVGEDFDAEVAGEKGPGVVAVENRTGVGSARTFPCEAVSSLEMDLKMRIIFI